MSTEFEKKLLYKYLGKDMVNYFKKYKAIVAGGAVTSIFTNSEINDIDVYLRSKEDVAALMEIMYDDFYIASHTKKATTFIKTVDEQELKIQLIHYNVFGSVDDVFEAFDFTICMGAFDFKNEQFSFHHNFFKHNSQRALRFNKNTHFPLISVIRTKKYEERNYTISKPELFRVIMKCMDLEINSYEELKDQLGGMYGISYDLLFQDIEDKEFSLDKAIDHIENLHMSDEYFEANDPVVFNNVDELISSATGLPIKYFKQNDNKYVLRFNGNIETLSTIKDNMIEVDISEVFPAGTKLYKYVKETEVGLISFYDKDFKYELDSDIVAKEKVGLFFNTYDNRTDSTYADDGGVLIEVSVNAEDFAGVTSNHLRFKKCKDVKVIERPSNNDKKDEGKLIKSLGNLGD
ncbi:hypothetical protein JOC34_000534 [Virgibacillus halotolerans]|uniref:hypothetical protein n=1 Tax=Virgibacillus halotolerans TaxID=1071053 RepID=UPI00195FED86|nr:hypothetical protein [Virgibacillus halotolerans]MBM7598177.1 hypothetical protein [Virgibacillus halotolerans]